MNTKGHESIAKVAGISLLEDIFGIDKQSLQALYLGNWLTDVSQAVDPVAYLLTADKSKRTINTIDSIVNDIKKSIDKLLEEILATIYDCVDVSQGSKKLNGY